MTQPKATMHGHDREMDWTLASSSSIGPGSSRICQGKLPPPVASGSTRAGVWRKLLITRRWVAQFANLRKTQTKNADLSIVQLVEEHSAHDDTHAPRLLLFVSGTKARLSHRHIAVETGSSTAGSYPCSLSRVMKLLCYDVVRLRVVVNPITGDI